MKRHAVLCQAEKGIFCGNWLFKKSLFLLEKCGLHHAKLLNFYVVFNFFSLLIPWLKFLYSNLYLAVRLLISILPACLNVYNRIKAKELLMFDFSIAI